jgi:hypothetical protein
MLRPKCDLCHDKRAGKDPAVVYLGEHAYKVCDECEMLFAVITEKVEEQQKLFGDIDEQSI